jgi:hypothetical protein
MRIVNIRLSACYKGIEMIQNEGTLKEELLRRFEQAHERLASSATAAAARGITQRGEQWGPREVLAHIVGWSAEATERIPRIIAGEPPLKYDDEAFNVAIITVLGDQSFDVVLDLFRQTHLRYIQMLGAQDKAVFVPGHPVYRRIQAVIEHHYEHAQGLDALT